ncbi:MAG: hypothetical protein ACFFD2_28275, partial [Promethearchaeota archaeon]
EEQINYYCVGLIERTSSRDNNSSFLYTFDKDEPLRKKYLSSIPSFYVMAILPDFYENLVQETLELFEITNYYANIRFINLSDNEKKVVYFEEFQEFRGKKRSLGLILVQAEKRSPDSNKFSTYRKELRQALDTNKNVEEFMGKVNPHFSIQKWGNNNEKDLDQIHLILDN